MKDEEEQKTIRIDLRKPGSLAWGMIWTVSIIRTGSLLVYASYDMWAHDKGIYNMAAINAFGDKAFPEFLAANIIENYCRVTGRLLLLVPLVLVFASTFVFTLMLRRIIFPHYLRYRSRAK